MGIPNALPGAVVSSTSYPRPITNYNLDNFRKNIVAMGDSLTGAAEYGVLGAKLWPSLLAGYLQQTPNNVAIAARNFGRSGDTTTQMIARAALMLNNGPAIYNPGVINTIEGGVNDPAASIPSATTTANLISLGTTMVNGNIRGGTNMIVIVSAHYLNFSTGGDTLSVPYAPYVPVRAAQLAAFNSLNSTYPGKFAYCDMHAYMQNIIASQVPVVWPGNLTGQLVAQGDFSWHFTDGNQHQNQFGHYVFAQAIRATILAQAGWIAAAAS